MEKEIKGTTRVCGLIGNPVHHTVSPAIHNTIAKAMGNDFVYVPFEVKNEDVESAIKGALALDIMGLNVTIPHKMAVIPFLKDIDPVAKRIGAVNTLVRTEDNSGFKGYNTDYYGIEMAFKDAGESLKGENVIILGAGGFARPAAFLCAEQGAKEVFILNRTLENAQKLAKSVNEYAQRELCKAMEMSSYKDIDQTKKYICFQVTSVGLYPETDKAVIEDEEFYKLIRVGFDGIYRPYNTRFLQLCKKNGAKVISGLEVLMYQGIYAYELWNKVKVSKEITEKVHEKMLSALLDGENIVLVGFMGSGKTAISKKIAGIFSYKKIDSDDRIEKSQKRKIKEIFAAEGEGYFRDLETNYLEKLCEDGEKGIVLSCGGGLPLRKENRELLKKFGKVVFLRAKPETVYDRIKYDKSRPLLQTEDVLGRIKSLQDERRHIYEEVCDIAVDTDGKKPVDIAKEIIYRIL